MLEVYGKIGHCSICKEEYTSTFFEASPGVKIYACENCLEAARYNFIWICLNCGKIYIKPKMFLMKNTGDSELKKIHAMLEDSAVIQGISMCLACNPDDILYFLEPEKMGTEC